MMICGIFYSPHQAIHREERYSRTHQPSQTLTLSISDRSARKAERESVPSSSEDRKARLAELRASAAVTSSGQAMCHSVGKVPGAGRVCGINNVLL